ncbi:hypothetical protein TSUD_43500 [Trifolium subterraneum]|uniref:Protein kinase domain-containing protein n=1 Tax=Trifolium subterraneum TaxID=3900 RepID=A0A2Z6NKY5_TRISU|nr:hypothetical protein TSUD_43500 [Trifolium subterraneum]
MGLPNSDKDSYFGVEFDTSYDPSLGDINGNHVGIDVNSVVSFASVDVLSRGVDLKSGKIINAWIEYRDDMKMVRVWVGYSSTRPLTPILASLIDLSEIFKEFMHVGFSASNGKGSSIHFVHHWQFKTLSYSHSVSPIDDVEEGDCFLCYSSDSKASKKNGGNLRRKNYGEIALGISGITAFVVSAMALAVMLCVILKRKKGGVIRKISEGQSCRFQTNKVPVRLSLSEITSATMGFNRDRLVGEGASAKVYKGSLPFGGDVAVKRFEKVDDLDRLHNPFATEFATMVGCLRHKNLVQLKGWCCEGNELVLVYEYLPNGSLDKVLHRNSSSSVVLSWNQRVNIILGVAAALTYLHEECERQIIHRDVKTCNIMLDSDFNAKLVATGRKPVGEDGTLVGDYVWNLWKKNRLIDAADPKLMGNFDVIEMERMLLVGLVCVHPDYEKRPRVKDAARMIKKEVPLPLLPTTKPRVRIRPICCNDSPESQKFVDDWVSNDEAPYLTPRSQFN